MMMAYGLEIADSKSLTVWTEATESGKLLYEANGFEVFKRLILNVDVEGDSHEIEARAKLQLPFTG